MTNQRKRAAIEAAGQDGRDLAERILERMREDAAKKPKSGVHVIGDRGVRTWCQIAISPVIRIADTLDQASCEECIELDHMRRAGIENGSYKHPLDAKLDDELGLHRPPTMGT